MTCLLCNRKDCVWCEPDEGICLETMVKITADGCMNYDTIFELPEYQETFYAAVRNNSEGGDCPQYYRAERMGKRIEYRGRVFYTTEKTDERDSFVVTDAATGAEVGTFARVKKRWDAFLRAAAQLPDVMTYPPCEVVGGKCIPVSEDEPEEDKPVVSSAEFTGILDDLKRLYGGV